MSQKSVDAIFREYDEIRSRNNSIKYRQIEDAYKKAPELLEISNQISKAGLQNAMKIANDVENADKYNNELEQTMKNLEAKRQEIMKKNNIPFDFDMPIYSCVDCRDTGFVDGKQCKCYKAKKIAQAYKNSNMDKLLSCQSFENFDINFYSDKKDGSGISPLYNMKQIYSVAKSFCDDFEISRKSLLFYGSAGLGKTFLSSCIAKSLLDQEYSVIYLGSNNFITLYDDYKYNRINDEQRLDMLQNLPICDLLIIDDLGTEALSKTGLAFFLDIINDRLINNKKMLISTNLSIDELSKRYTPRFTSRVYESFTALKFIGEDIRKQKLLGNTI